MNPRQRANLVKQEGSFAKWRDANLSLGARPSATFRARLSILELSFVCATLMLHANSASAQLPGGNIVGAEVYGRPWNLVSNSEPWVTVRGTLRKTKFNTGPAAVHDWDTNIFVQPDSNSARFATNVYGSVNPPSEGLGAGGIEFEVKTLEWTLNDQPDGHFRNFFRDTFYIGGPIEARGLWVQDWGHEPTNPKTELHPIAYLREQYVDGFGLFVPRDVSGRFSVTPSSPQTFRLDFAAERNELSLAGGDQANATTFAAVVFERSMMDISTSTRSGLQRSLGTYPAQPYFQVSVTLGEPDLKETVEPGGHYHPFYLGQVRSFRNKIFEDSIQATVKPCEQTGLPATNCPGGKKVAVLTIRAKLLPAMNPWNYEPTSWGHSRWKLSRGDPAQGNGNVTFEDVARNGESASAIEFVRFYSPELGMTDNRWLLYTYALRDSRAFASLPPKAGQGPGDLAVLYKERIYSFSTSRMEVVNETLARRETRTEAAWKQGAFAFEVKCSPSIQKFYATLHPMTDVHAVPNTFLWEVSPSANSTGTPPSGSQAGWHQVTQQSGPWQWNGLKAEVDSSDKRRLIVSFTPQSDTQLAGPLLFVRASESTDIGETVVGETAFRKDQCRLVGGPGDLMESIVKGLMAIEYLRERGLLPDVVPGNFTDLLGPERSIPWNHGQQAVMPEPYELLPTIKGQPRLALEAYYKVMSGRSISRIEKSALARFAIESSLIRWSPAPPPGAFKMLHNITERTLSVPKMPVLERTDEMPRFSPQKDSAR